MSSSYLIRFNAFSELVQEKEINIPEIEKIQNGSINQPSLIFLYAMLLSLMALFVQ